MTVRRAMVGLSIFGTILVVGTSLYSLATHGTLLRKPAPVVRPLPLDADSLVKDFTFSRDLPDGSLMIRGKQVVRRGRRFFAVRSTVLKTTSFDDVSGVYTDRKNKVEFTARKAEWDLLLDTPLTLQEVERLSINDTTLEHLRTTKIFFDKHVVRVYGGETKTYFLE